MQLNESFTSYIQTAYGPVGKEWLALLPKHISILSEEWGFEFIDSIGNSKFNFIGLVQLNLNKKLAILKTAPPSSTLMKEASCLKSFNSTAVSVYHVDPMLNAILIEMRPGPTLKSLVINEQDSTATTIICNIISQLQAMPVPYNDEFTNISTFINDFQFLKGHIDDRALIKCQTLYDELCSDSSEDILIHGDLHHDNILQCGNHWKIIDPHGYIGNPVAEIGPMIFNPIDYFLENAPLKKIIEKRLKTIIELLPFDPKEVKGWAYCRTLLSAAWDIENFGNVGKERLEIASIIDETYL